MQGFETSVSGTVTVNLGGNTHYDFKLHTLWVLQDTVTVSGENHGLETDRTSLDTNVTAQQIADLPLNGAISLRSGPGSGSFYLSAAEHQSRRNLLGRRDVCHG